MSGRLLRVRVQPRAPRSEIVGWRADGVLSVRVAAPAVEGQANAALAALLAGALAVRFSAITVEHGVRGRDKLVRVDGVPPEEIRRRITGAEGEGRRRRLMKTVLCIATLGALLAVTVPALADHTSAPAPAESSLDVDLKLGPKSFRIGGRVFGRDGYAGGAWLNGETRSDGFSLDGRVERDGKAHNFRFNADIDAWLRRAILGGVTDL